MTAPGIADPAPVYPPSEQPAPRTIADGIPHIAYFRPDRQLSFVWNGGPLDPIEVEHGGYGEPVIAFLDAAGSGGCVTLPGVLAWFQEACDEWADADVLELRARDLQIGDHYRGYGTTDRWHRIHNLHPGDMTRVYADDAPDPACFDGNTVVEAIRVLRT